MITALIKVIISITIISALLACTEKTSSQPDASPVPERHKTITGKATKGPLVGATIQVFALDDNGLKSGPVITQTNTDNQGNWTLSITPSAEIRLIEAAGGSFIDETDPSKKRTIELTNTDTLQSLLLPNQTQSAITMLTHTLVKTYRHLLAQTNNKNIALNYLQQRAIASFGFDPFLVLPADPLNPIATDTELSRTYALVVGGLANIANNAAVELEQAYMNYTFIDLVASDYATCQFNGTDHSGAMVIDINGTMNPWPTPPQLANEIKRFRNNHYELYNNETMNTPLPTIQQAELCYRGPYAQDDQLTSLENSSVVIHPLSNDYDPDSDIITISMAPTTTTQGGVVQLNTDNSLTYLPPLGFTGVDSFQYTATDDNSATHNINQAIIHITVNANLPPTANNDLVETNEDNAVDINVLSNDTDNENDSLSIVSFSLAASNGKVSQIGPTTLRYQPNENYHDTDHFSYTITDGISSSTATVTVNVQPINDQPTGFDDAYSTVNDTPISNLNILSNDIDIDGDELNLEAFDSNSLQGGIITNLNGVLTYTPPVSFVGIDSFTYTVKDTVTISSPITVTVTVSLVPNNAPIAKDDTATTTEERRVSIAVTNNDTDSDGDTLSISTFQTKTPYGFITKIDEMTLRYTPVSDDHESDSFSYTITDGKDTSSATVSITIKD